MITPHKWGWGAGAAAVAFWGWSQGAAKKATGALKAVQSFFTPKKADGESQYKAVQQEEGGKSVQINSNIKAVKEKTLIWKKAREGQETKVVDVKVVSKSIEPKVRIKTVKGKQDIISVKTTELTKAVKQ